MVICSITTTSTVHYTTVVNITTSIFIDLFLVPLATKVNMTSTATTVLYSTSAYNRGGTATAAINTGTISGMTSHVNICLGALWEM